MPRLTRLVAALALVLVSTACAYRNPTAPTAGAPPIAGVPASLQVEAVSGTGAAGGTVAITAIVRDAFASAVPDASVQFVAASGTVASPAVTNAKGIAATTLTAPAGAVLVTVTTGALQSQTLIAVQPLVTPPPPPPVPVPPPPATPGDLTVTLASSTAPLGTPNVFAATIKNAVSPFTVRWTYGDGTTTTGFGSTTAHTYAAIGSYTATATVQDDAGRSVSASAPVTVTTVVPIPPPPPPAPLYSVSLAAAPTSVTVGGTATLTATVTPINGAGPPTAFAWDCTGNGTTIVTTGSATQPCTYATVGTTSSRVTVTGGSATGSGTVAVAVTAPVAPVVTVSCSTATRPAASPCVVSATLAGTAVPSAQITITAWDWGDGLAGLTGTGAGFVNQSHPYGAANAAGYHPVVSATVPGGNGAGLGAGTAIVQ